jgi:hypothetical protein
MEFKKHIGKRKESGVRVAVVYMTLPDDPYSALVVDLDSLTDAMRDDLQEIMNSPEAQGVKQLYDILHRRMYRHGGSLLEALHQNRNMMKVATSDIIMTPHPSHTISLDELNDQIRKIEEGSESVTDEDMQASRNVRKQQIENLQEEEKAAIGRNLLYEATELEEQAKLLMKTAGMKRDEAVKYMPVKKKNTNKKMVASGE